jgi:hypothetical protein
MEPSHQLRLVGFARVGMDQIRPYVLAGAAAYPSTASLMAGCPRQKERALGPSVRTGRRQRYCHAVALPELRIIAWSNAIFHMLKGGTIYQDHTGNRWLGSLCRWRVGTV